MPVLPPLASDNAAPTIGAGASTPAFSPLYQQIKGLILQSLEAGEWRPGELIPSEMELAARFRVSQGTVRKANDELAAENLVMRRQGKDRKSTRLNFSHLVISYAVFCLK